MSSAIGHVARRYFHRQLCSSCNLLPASGIPAQDCVLARCILLIRNRLAVCFIAMVVFGVLVVTPPLAPGGVRGRLPRRLCQTRAMPRSPPIEYDLEEDGESPRKLGHSSMCEAVSRDVRERRSSFTALSDLVDDTASS